MSLDGKATAKNTIKGNVSLLKTIHGYSAYEIAVINGFKGTEDEWLNSLKGAKGDKGERGDKGDTGAQGVKGDKGDNGADYVLTEADIDQIVAKVMAQANKISSVTLAENQWQGATSPYSQVVNIAGATENSKIDLNPTIEQLNIFYEKDITFVVANSGGVITVYCIGQKPTNDYTIQVSITEVVRYE